MHELQQISGRVGVVIGADRGDFISYFESIPYANVAGVKVRCWFTQIPYASRRDPFMR